MLYINFNNLNNDGKLIYINNTKSIITSPDTTILNNSNNGIVIGHGIIKDLITSANITLDYNNINHFFIELFTGIHVYTFLSFYILLNSHSNINVNLNDILNFFTFVWGTDKSLLVSIRYFKAIPNILDAWDKVEGKSESIDSFRNFDGSLNWDIFSNATAISLFIPILDSPTVLSNPSFYSETHQKRGIRIQLIILNGKLVLVEGYFFGCQSVSYTSGISKVQSNKTVKFIDIRFTPSNIRKELSHLNFRTQSNHNLSDILEKLSEYGIFDLYYGNPEDIFDIFSMLFYNIKLNKSLNL